MTSQSFYTSVFRHNDSVIVNEVVDGEKKRKKLPLKYRVGIPSKEGNYHGIHGERLAIREFSKWSDMRDYTRPLEESGVRLYNMIDPVVQFLSDRYSHNIQPDFSMIDIGWIDIEVGSENGFPDPAVADEMLTGITVFSTKDKKFHVFTCCGTWRLADTELDYLTADNLEHYDCADEGELIVQFIRFWRKQGFDVVVGWNSKGFDIPYLVNRIRNVFGDEYVKKLSPVKKVVAESFRDSYGNEQYTYRIVGIHVIDLLEIYKKYVLEPREKYTLDFIASEEIGDKKLEYEGSLHDLYKTNYQKYIDYNIHDVYLTMAIDDKRKLLSLFFEIAYYAKVPFDSVLSPVNVWDAVIFNHLKEKNILVPPKPQTKKSGKFAGAYVQEPKPGRYNWLVSFDLNSLYPSIYRFLNLGVDKSLVDNPMLDLSIEDLIEMKPDLSEAKKLGVSVAANGLMTRIDRQSFMSVLLENLYAERKNNKSISLDYKSKAEEIKTLLHERGIEPKGDDAQFFDAPIQELSDEQLVKLYNFYKQNALIYGNKEKVQKVLLNSLYGAGGNEFFRYYNIKIAEAVTKTAQLVIRYVSHRFNTYMKKQAGIEQAVVYADTDSNYLDFSPIVERLDSEGKLSDSEIADKIDALCENKIQKLLDKWFDELFNYLNGYQNTLAMKREKICSGAFFVSKKRYALRVLDNEGVRYEKPKLSVSGLESKKSSTPEPARKKLKELYELILDNDVQEINRLVKSFRQEWRELPLEKISLPSSVNGMEKYVNDAGLPIKGTPAHVYGAIMLNWYMNKKGEKKFKRIVSGDKIKYVYMKQPNPVKHTHVLSFDDVQVVHELGLDEYVDKDMMFEKGFMSAAKNTLDACQIKITEKRSLGI